MAGLTTLKQKLFRGFGKFKRDWFQDQGSDKGNPTDALNDLLDKLGYTGDTQGKRYRKFLVEKTGLTDKQYSTSFLEWTLLNAGGYQFNTFGQFASFFYTGNGIGVDENGKVWSEQGLNKRDLVTDYKVMEGDTATIYGTVSELTLSDDDFVFEGWVGTGDYATNQYFFDSRSGSNNGYVVGQQHNAHANYANMLILIASGGSGTMRNYRFPALTTKTYVKAHWDGTIFRVWYNEVEQTIDTTVTSNSIVSFTPNDSAYIGRYHNGSSDYLNGEINDVKIGTSTGFNHAWTINESSGLESLDWIGGSRIIWNAVNWVTPSGPTNAHLNTVGYNEYRYMDGVDDRAEYGNTDIVSANISDDGYMKFIFEGYYEDPTTGYDFITQHNVSQRSFRFMHYAGTDLGFYIADGATTGNWYRTSTNPITASGYYILEAWVKLSEAGQSNGEVQFYVNGSHYETVTGIAEESMYDNSATVELEIGGSDIVNSFYKGYVNLYKTRIVDKDGNVLFRASETGSLTLTSSPYNLYVSAKDQSIDALGGSLVNGSAKYSAQLSTPKPQANGVDAFGRVHDLNMPDPVDGFYVKLHVTRGNAANGIYFDGRNPSTRYSGIIFKQEVGTGRFQMAIVDDSGNQKYWEWSDGVAESLIDATIGSEILLYYSTTNMRIWLDEAELTSVVKTTSDDTLGAITLHTSMRFFTNDVEGNALNASSTISDLYIYESDINRPSHYFPMGDCVSGTSMCKVTGKNWILWDKIAYSTGFEVNQSGEFEHHKNGANYGYVGDGGTHGWYRNIALHTAIGKQLEASDVLEIEFYYHIHDPSTTTTQFNNAIFAIAEPVSTGIVSATHRTDNKLQMNALNTVGVGSSQFDGTQIWRIQIILENDEATFRVYDLEDDLQIGRTDTVANTSLGVDLALYLLSEPDANPSDETPAWFTGLSVQLNGVDKTQAVWDGMTQGSGTKQYPVYTQFGGQDTFDIFGKKITTKRHYLNFEDDVVNFNPDSAIELTNAGADTSHSLGDTPPTNSAVASHKLSERRYQIGHNTAYQSHAAYSDHMAAVT